MLGLGRWIWASGFLLLLAGPSAAQGPGVLVNNGIGPYYQPPGLYGTAYGVPAYGVPRTYTAYSSPYGGGYGYGYAPYVSGLNWFTVNPGGVSLVRPGFSIPGYTYGAARYSTFAAPFTIATPPPPPFGVYAPGFGPPAFTTY